MKCTVFLSRGGFRNGELTRQTRTKLFARSVLIGFVDAPRRDGGSAIRS